MTTTRKIGVAIAIVVTLFVAFGIYYAMPRAKKVVVTQTEVQRREPGVNTKAPTRDMLLIYAADFDTKKPLVFRNEDNLFYLKVDSSDVASHAARLSKDNPDGAVLVRYYGVRIPIFSAYPNALSLTEVADDYTHIPWVSVLYLIVVLVLFLFLGVKIRKLFRAAKDKVTNRPPAS